LAVQVDDPARLSACVQGRVQGVGFRYWVRSLARDLGLQGSAVNLIDGQVAVVVEGPREACEALLAALDSDDAPGYVEAIVKSWSEPVGEPNGFRVG
jgi:acylphosphatase